MGEARELFTKFRAECRSLADSCEIDSPIELALREIVSALGATLATQPDPVPELPEFVVQVTDGMWKGEWRVILADDREHCIDGDYGPDDLDRIAEAARILAARERARRAGR